MVIERLNLRHFSDGQYKHDYYQRTILVPQGIGNESNAFFVVLANSLKVQVYNCTIWESLDTIASIQADTAKWGLVADSATDPTFVLDRGASFLKIINTSGSETALLLATGV